MILGRNRSTIYRTARILLMVVLSVLPAVAYLVAANQGILAAASGSTIVGLITGVLAGAIFFFEAFLGLRKQYRRKRLGKLRYWMSLHIWLGILTLPLVLVHCAGKFGGLLTATLMVTFLIVYLSGLWGLVLQQVLPGTLMNTFRGETIASEIDQVMQQWVDELEVELNKLTLITQISNRSIFSQKFEFDLGSQKRGTSVELLESTESQMEESEFLGLVERVKLSFDKQVKPYLLEGGLTHPKMRSVNHADRIFVNLTKDLPEESTIRQMIKRMEEACSLRREKDLQRTFYTWLHSWLWFHLPFTLVLMILLVVHVLVALKMW